MLAEFLYTKSENQLSHVFAWSGNVLVQSSTGVQVYRHTDNQQKLYANVFQKLGSKEQNGFSLDVMDVGSMYEQEDTQVLRLQPEVWRIQTSDAMIMYIGKAFEDWEGTLPSVSLKSDFWMLERTIIPDILPIPKQGIIYLPNRKPGKSLLQFSIQKNIPLLSLQGKRNIWLRFKNEVWDVRQASS